MAETQHDIDAERAVLGAVLLQPALFAAARGIVTDTDFFRTANADIYRAMLRLDAAGTTIDYMSVSRELEHAKRLDDVTPVYIVNLVDGVPKASNITYYAERVRDAAVARAVVSQLTAAAEKISTEGLTADTLAPLRAALAIDAPAAPVFAHEQRVADEMIKGRARRDAHRRLDAEERGAIEMPTFETLADRLARPRQPKRTRIAGWQPWGTRVMLAAQFKAGKTTLRNDLVRSLVDGDPFLGRAQVTPVTANVVVLDLELSEDMHDDWYRELGIRNADRVVSIPMRGKATSFNIMDPRIRAEWAAKLREWNTSYLILDCLRPLLDVFGLDEKSDAGKVLGPFDALLAEADVTDACIVHHMGHTGERTRGDSRLRDWPDVEWRLTRETDDPRSPRYLTAFGRDVDVSESRLSFDPATRRLTLAGGSRKSSAASAALQAVIDVLEASGDAMTGRAVTKAVTEATEHKVDAVTAALKDGRQPGGPLQYEDGPNRSYLYSLKPGVRVSGGVRTVYGNTPDSRCTGVLGAYKAPDTTHRTGGAHERF